MLNKIVVLDANSLIHRAYHALPGLSNSKGQPTGAVYGFLGILLSLIKKENPTHMAAAFDMAGPTFRHCMFTEYKAKRKPTDEALCAQFPLIRKLLSLMKIAVIEKEGFEADDILGTIAKRFSDDTVLVTGDRDSFQLVGESTRVYWTKRGISDIEEIDLNKLAEMGFTPKSYVDYKAMRGDPSDNIPGIPGVGEKTALELLNNFSTLENLLDSADKIPGRLGEIVRNSREIALLSKKLSQIDCNVPIEVKLSDLEFSSEFPLEVKSFLLELEITSPIARMKFSEKTQKAEETARKITTVELSDKKAVINAFGNYKDAVALYLGEDLCFAFDENKQFAVKTVQNLFDEAMDFDDAVALLKALCADKYVIAFDLKKLIRAHGFNIKNGFDIMLAAHLARGSATIKNCQTLLGREKADASACGVFSISKKLKDELKNQELEKLYYDIEFPLLFVLADMEARGFSVDIGVLAELEEQYKKEIADLTARIYQCAECEFNIGSPRQTAEVLFNKLKLESGKKNKTGLSVDEEVLEKLRGEHPVIPLILEWRHKNKLLSTYISGLMPLVSDGKLHTDFNQAITATGRLSSTNPNLQNLPARAKEAKQIKNAFCGTGDNVLVAADYSQIELRLLAHFSGDQALILQYQNASDIHAATAAQIFKVPLDMVTADMRRDAKAVNFGIVYGISDFGLAQNLSIPKFRAKEFIENYFARYAAVKIYLEKNVEFARQNGYAVTLCGRRRRLDDINSSNHIIRTRAERTAMNTPLQGSASDIVKIAMLELEKRLIDMKSKMILQVHDELIVDAAPEEVEAVKTIMLDVMQNAVKLAVPLTVNVEAGKRWGELE
jgi:DNA polymerase-1